MITDTGIALGRIAFSRTHNFDPSVVSEVQKIRLLTSLIAMFFIGGVTGALGFKHVGFLFTLPLAEALLLMAILPIMDDYGKPKEVLTKPRDQNVRPLQPLARVSALMLEFNKQVNASIVDPEFIASVRRKLALVNAFSRYENGNTKPPLALVKLLKVLERHPDLLAEIKTA